MRDWIWKMMIGSSPIVVVILLKYIAVIRRRTYIRGEKVDEIEVARKRYQMKRGNKLANSELPILKFHQSKSFPHQVAGHFHEVLRQYKDMILKPLNKMNLFLRELSFYETWAQYGIQSSRFPHPFLPKYYGVVMCENSDGVKIPFLALENLALKYCHPCVIDIKMGQQTYEPSASVEKINREHSKYPYQHTIGFRVTGFKVYDSIVGKYFEVRKGFGRGLTPELVKSGLACFFFNGTEYRVDVIYRVIQQLKILLQWITIQRSWTFYCSSLLIIYEAERYVPVNVDDPNGYQVRDQSPHFLERCLEEYDPDSTHSNPSLPPADHQLNSYQYLPVRNDERIDVKMIDHAHTLPAAPASAVATGVDESYLYSLRSLISHLEEICADVREGKLLQINPDLASPLLKGLKGITSNATLIETGTQGVAQG